MREKKTRNSCRANGLTVSNCIVCMHAFFFSNAKLMHFFFSSIFCVWCLQNIWRIAKKKKRKKKQLNHQKQKKQKQQKQTHPFQSGQKKSLLSIRTCYHNGLILLRCLFVLDFNLGFGFWNSFATWVKCSVLKGKKKPATNNWFESSVEFCCCSCCFCCFLVKCTHFC